MPSDKSHNEASSMLKSAREAKGLTLDIVHEATKIPMDALKAIEEGYSVRILSPFYYRGFIKIYAEFLGLEAREVFKDYGLDAVKSDIPKPQVKVTASKETQPSIILGQVQEWSTSFLNPKHFKKYFKFIAIIVAVFVLVRIAGCIGAHWKAMPKTKKSAVMLNTKKDSEKQIKEDAVKPVKLIEQKTVQAKSENHKVELAVRALKDSWIQVKADDKVVFQMTMKKGTMESWSANQHIELSGRSINELDFEVNGKHIGSLGTAERKAKKVMITQDGLTVKK